MPPITAPAIPRWRGDEFPPNVPHASLLHAQRSSTGFSLAGRKLSVTDDTDSRSSPHTAGHPPPGAAHASAVGLQRDAHLVVRSAAALAWTTACLSNHSGTCPYAIGHNSLRIFLPWFISLVSGQVLKEDHGNRGPPQGSGSTLSSPAAIRPARRRSTKENSMAWMPSARSALL